MLSNVDKGGGKVTVYRVEGGLRGMKTNMYLKWRGLYKEWRKHMESRMFVLGIDNREG